MINLNLGRGICYSGYRKGQSPHNGIYPRYAQIKEDLLILQGDWACLRLYDSGPHAEIVLDVIEKEGFNFQIMLGAAIGAEVSNENCPWGAIYSKEVLERNRDNNLKEIEKMVMLAKRYQNTVFSVSVGNEATADWTDHKVPNERVIEYANWVKSSVSQPVTYCEGCVPWLNELDELVEAVDFISLHSYPIWESKPINVAFASTQEDYYGICQKYPGKPVVITEAGWTTTSDGVRILEKDASEELQTTYCQDLLRWTDREGILTFVFEAFDEPWKGSSNPAEPEKHWGIYTADRRPKKLVGVLQGAEV